MSSSPRASRRIRPALAALLLLFSACHSTVVAVDDRGVHDELETIEWRVATEADLVGHWRARSLHGPAAAVLMDLAYWMDATGRFSGAALFIGPPPTYEVLSGTWSLGADGALQLGEDAELARAEVGGPYLRITGAEGTLILERAEIR